MKEYIDEMPNSHPCMAKFEIDTVDWYDLCRLDENHSETNIIGHDNPAEDGHITVYIACANDDVRAMLLKAFTR
jgi:hypothetical protein